MFALILWALVESVGAVYVAISNLDPTGIGLWYSRSNVEAADLNSGVAAIEKLLHRLRRLRDPAGGGAQSADHPHRKQASVADHSRVRRSHLRPDGHRRSEGKGRR